MRNYYQTLGVLEDAEDIVIRAAYKALAQRYHPDKWKGNQEEASRKMAEINGAYEVLSDPVKRKKYDEEIADQKGNYESETESESAAEEGAQEIKYYEDWLTAVDYFPNLERHTTELNKLSSTLVFRFQLILLSEKSFDKAEKIAKKFESDYLIRYFGDNAEIRGFAKRVIFADRKDIAKEINRAVRVLGPNASAERIIPKIKKKYSDYFWPKKAQTRKTHTKSEQNKARSSSDGVNPSFVIVTFSLIILGVLMGMIWS